MSSEDDSLLVTPQDQVEHELVTTSVEIEQLDADLFRSKSLWKPPGGRGVFGGQVISQALLAATNTVPDDYNAHSLHSYFLLSANPSQPIIYHVDRVREGKTYATRTVKATQAGKTVFLLTSSFQRPEISSRVHQWPFPSDVTSPEDSETAAQRVERLSSLPEATDKSRKYLANWLRERNNSPVEIRTAQRVTNEHGSLQSRAWLRCRNIPKFKPQFHKCFLAYMTDFLILGVGADTVGLSWGRPPPSALGLITTLDHSIWYYDHDFDCSDWLLHVMESSRAGMGRSIVHGRVYTKEGKLVAIVVQEGVVRAADEKPPTKL